MDLNYSASKITCALSNPSKGDEDLTLNPAQVSLFVVVSISELSSYPVGIYMNCRPQSYYPVLWSGSSISVSISVFIRPMDHFSHLMDGLVCCAIRFGAC